jgi:hypothetical protein
VGASISCCWKGCPNKYHYMCAKEIGKSTQRERERREEERDGERRR